MQINYDFPWYLQNSEGFMAMYTGLFNVATTISPISFLSCLDVDHAEYPQQIKTIAMLYGLRGDWVSIEDALIYDVKKWSVHPATLPDGYTELEYIEASGAQYLPTGIMLASTDVVECTFKNASDSAYGALYGVYASGKNSCFYANVTYYGYDIANNQVNTQIAVDTQWHSVHHDFTNGELTVDGTTVNFNTGAFTNTSECRLFQRYYNGAYGYPFSGAISSFKVYRSGTLILDLVPAKHGDDVGMYDTVSETFIVSGSSDPFVAGPQGSSAGEVNYWSGRLADTLDLLTNYIKAKVQIRNKNLTLQSLKQFFAVCLAHRNFDPDTAITVTESTLHFDLTVAVDEEVLNDMVTLLSVDPWPFGKPTGISYSINYVQQ